MHLALVFFAAGFATPAVVARPLTATSNNFEIIMPRSSQSALTNPRNPQRHPNDNSTNLTPGSLSQSTSAEQLKEPRPTTRNEADAAQSEPGSGSASDTTNPNISHTPQHVVYNQQRRISTIREIDEAQLERQSTRQSSASSGTQEPQPQNPSDADQIRNLVRGTRILDELYTSAAEAMHRLPPGRAERHTFAWGVHYGQPLEGPVPRFYGTADGENFVGLEPPRRQQDSRDT